MTDTGLKIEETFLSRAAGNATHLRLLLSNREKLSGVVTFAGRYDVNIDSGGNIVTLPKKEIASITPDSELLEPSFFGATPETVPVTSRSRVQDEFLNRYIKEKTLALFSFNSGDEIRGVVEGYDGFTISIRTGRGQVLLYKHGICSIGPGYRRHSGKDDAR